MKNFRKNALVLGIFAVFVYLAVIAHVVAKDVTDQTHSQTPKQDVLFDKPLDDATTEEIADAFIEAVFGGNVVFDRLIETATDTSPSFKTLQGNKLEHIGHYTRKEFSLSPNNPEHRKWFKEQSLSTERSVYKTATEQSLVPFILRHYIGWQLSDVEQNTVHSEWRATVEQEASHLIHEIQKATGRKIPMVFALNREQVLESGITSTITLIHYHFHTSSVIHERAWTKKDMPLPLNPRIVSEVHFLKPGLTPYRKSLRVTIPLQTSSRAVVCGEHYKPLGGSVEEAIAGCLFKALGLPHFKTPITDTEYGLFFLQVLYDKRIKNEMTEKEIRKILPEIIKSIRKGSE